MYLKFFGHCPAFGHATSFKKLPPQLLYYEEIELPLRNFLPLSELIFIISNSFLRALMKIEDIFDKKGKDLWRHDLIQFEVWKRVLSAGKVALYSLKVCLF